MSLESGSYINDLVITNPTSSDPKSQGDDHFQLIKKVLKECLNGFTGGILLTATESGTASAHVLTPTTALVGYTTGLMLLYRPTNAGTGALTVNVSALGAKSVKTIAGTDPTSGDILASQPVLLMYDGTNFVILAGSEYLSKTGNQTLTGNLTLTGNQTVSGTLGVTGATTITGALTVGGVVTIPPTGSGSTEAARKDYVDASITNSGTIPVWVSGTTYAFGAPVFSPTNLQTYRRLIAGDGTTDPSLDPVNWASIPASTNATYNQSALVTLPVGTAVSSLYDRLSIDATRELLIFTSTTAVQAVVWDNTAKMFGTAVLVRAFAAAPGVGALLIGTDKVLVLSAPASANTLEAVVLTFTGATITVNTAATQAMPQTMYASSGDGKTYGIAHSGVACGSSYVFSLKLASSVRTIAVTVSGTTPTIGTSLDMGGSGSVPHILGIDSTRLLCLYYTGAVIAAVPITVSAGTTLTAGTSASFGAGSSAWRHFTALTTGRWAVVYTATNSYGAIVSVSGTVATVSTVLLNAAADMSNGAVVKIGDQLVVQCSTTKVNVLTDVTGTATAGTAVTTQTLLSGGACCAFGSDYAVFGGTSGYDIIKISGNAPVLYEQGQVQSGVLSTGNEEWSDSYPGKVLSSATRSGLVVRSATPTELMFTSTGPQDVCNVASFVTNNCGHQSAAVLWAGYQPVASTTVRIHRLEML